MEKLRQRIKFGKWHRLLQDGPSFFGGRHLTQLSDRSFKVDMTRFIRERLRPISLQQGRCLDKSAEATVRVVAGSLSGVARQCRPDEAGTASTLQGSVSRAVVKDLSDANRAVNRLKQTEDVGLLTHAIPLVVFCTVSIPDAALNLTFQTVRHGEASWSGLPCQNSTSKDQSAVIAPMSLSSRSVRLWLEKSS